MTIKKIFLLSTSLLGLVACGGTAAVDGGGPIVIGNEEETARVFSNDIGDAGDALVDGQTLTARQVAMAGVHLNYDSGETEITDVSEFTVRLNAEGEVTLELAGTEIVFTSADRDPDEGGETYGYFTQEQCDTLGFCVSLFSQSGEIDELKSNGNGFLEVLSAQSNQISEDGALNIRAYAVVGTETEDADLGSLGSATYQGWTRFDLFPETGFINNSESRTRLRSDVTMTADFGAGTISGVMDAFEVRDAGESDFVGVLGSIAMTEAEFSVNGFEGGLAPDAEFLAENDVSLDASSSYSGAFYGPNAEEVGGVFSVSGTDESEAFNGIGFFEAYQ